MKSFLKEIEKKFKTVNEAELCEECGMHECKCVNEIMNVNIDDIKSGKIKPEEDLEDEDVNVVAEEGLDEISATGAGEAYQTPKAFGKADDKTIEVFGYKKVQEAMDKKYEAIIESYSKFTNKGGSKASPSRTVNTTIREVAKKLQEIEQLINYTGRLKNESGMTRAEYGKSTNTALNKISERLLKISERVRRLGE